MYTYVLDMDDLSRALDESVLSDLECPVCMEYMVPPIKLCTNGHSICNICRQSVQCCPTCRASFTETRNVALENIARRVKYPCTNRQGGCLDVFSIEHIAEHQAVCVYREIKCPFHTYWHCPWKGFKCHLKKHAQAAHSKSFFECSKIRFIKLEAFVILSCYGEFFTYNHLFRNGELYGAVQLIGTNSETSKYKCVFTLRAENGIEQISKTFLVRSYTEDWETSFNSGKCLRLDQVTVRKFYVKNNLSLSVKLFPV